MPNGGTGGGWYGRSGRWDSPKNVSIQCRPLYITINITCKKSYIGRKRGQQRSKHWVKMGRIHIGAETCKSHSRRFRMGIAPFVLILLWLEAKLFVLSGSPWQQTTFLPFPDWSELLVLCFVFPADFFFFFLCVCSVLLFNLALDLLRNLRM